jgi:hypothetical protein
VTFSSIERERVAEPAVARHRHQPALAMVKQSISSIAIAPAPPGATFLKNAASSAANRSVAIVKRGSLRFTEHADSLKDRLKQLILERPTQLRLRTVRTLLFGVLILCFILAYPVTVLPHAHKQAAARYDPSVGLSIHVGACDLVFIEGPDPTIRLFSVREAAVEPDFTWASSGVASSMRAENVLQDCRRSAANSCSDLCRVTVHVPQSSTADFTVEQRREDRSTPRFEFTGIAAHAINLGFVGRRSNVNAYVLMVNCTLGSLMARLDSGYVRASNSRIGSVDLHSDKSGAPPRARCMLRRCWRRRWPSRWQRRWPRHWLTRTRGTHLLVPRGGVCFARAAPRGSSALTALCARGAACSVLLPRQSRRDGLCRR